MATSNEVARLCENIDNLSFENFVAFAFYLFDGTREYPRVAAKE
jgi:hypothetical protein